MGSVAVRKNVRNRKITFFLAHSIAISATSQTYGLNAEMSGVPVILPGFIQ